MCNKKQPIVKLKHMFLKSFSLYKLIQGGDKSVDKYAFNKTLHKK